MPKPTQLILNKTNQKEILKEFKNNSRNARTIAKTLNLPYRQIMFFLEQQKLRVYAEESYS